MKHIIIVSIILSGLINFAFGQQNYWQKTVSTPTDYAGQGNTSIANNGYDIFIGTKHNGIFRSADKGITWQNVLPATDTAIEKIVVSPEGKIYAIAANNVFMSYNNGDDWHRKITPAQYALTDLEVLNDGTILVSSHFIIDLPDEDYDFFGDGVLRSSDDGNTWQAINEGFTYTKAISHIAVSSTGILFAAMPSTKRLRGGLYYSLNKGDNWQRISHPQFKGLRGDDMITLTSIYDIYCLEFDHLDNLYFSYEGILEGNGAGQGGMVSNINDVFKQGNLWRPLPLNRYGYDWMYKPFHSVHVSEKSGHLHASLNTFNSVSQGGAYVHKGNEGFRWIKTGVDPVLNSYLKMIYTEDPDGRIYAVQLLDHNVYFSDSSASPSTGIADQIHKSHLIRMYPNPATDHVNVSCTENANAIEQVNIYDPTGKLLTTEIISGNSASIQLSTSSFASGLYLIETKTKHGFMRSKVQIGR